MQTVAMQGFEQVIFGNPIGCDRKDGLWANIQGRWYKISANRTIASWDFAVTPAMIKRVGFCGVFGRMECEIFASLLVRLAQKTGGWDFFSLEDLNRFETDCCNASNLEFFAELGFLKEENGRYHYTVGFVTEVLGGQ